MTHVAKPPKSEHVEADVSREPVVSERMWAVVVRRPSGGWFIETDSVSYKRSKSIGLFNGYWGDGYYAYHRMRRQGKARAVRVTVSVDPGQLEDKA